MALQIYRADGTRKTTPPGVVPLVTALPAVPSDGQQIDFQDATMAALGVRWRLVYNAASVSAYKWEFVGGSELRTSSSAVVALSSAAMIELTPLISIVLPLAGDYTLTAMGTGARIGAGVADFQIQASITAAALGGWLYPLRVSGTALSVPNDVATIWGSYVCPGLAAASRIAWFGLAGNLNITLRQLRALPVRVG